MLAGQIHYPADEAGIAVKCHVQAGEGIGLVGVYPQLGYHCLGPEPFKKGWDDLIEGLEVLLVS